MVIWSDLANADLRSIHDFIARNSKHYAKKVAQDIVAKTGVLNELPLVGRMVTELDDGATRELSLYSYRGAQRVLPLFMPFSHHPRKRFGQSFLHDSAWSSASRKIGRAHV